MRMFSSSLMGALVVLALFWGNCFSCPQVLLALKSHQPAHGCCHRTNKQSSNDCQTQVLRQFVKADTATPAPAPAMAAAVAEPAPVSVVLRAFAPATMPAEHAPPDLLSLHSNFRI